MRPTEPTKRVLIRLVKALWIAVQLVLVIIFMQRGALFFYQGF